MGFRGIGMVDAFDAAAKFDFTRLTEEQLRNHIRDFAGTPFEHMARAELERRGIKA